jgi:hypothetical protein
MAYSMTGTELVEVAPIGENGQPGMAKLTVTATQLTNFHNTDSVYNTNTATTSATLSAANLLGGYSTVYLNMTGALGSGQNITLPTAAAMVAAAPDLSAGDSYTLRIINSSAGNYAWTLLTATGWTFNVTTATIAQNTWRDFLISFQSTSAATIQSVGSGTYTA